jgi:hypothetical protein
MKTGPEHYKLAQKSAEVADEFLLKGRPELAVPYYQAAQVHATLALAAATADTKWMEVSDGSRPSSYIAGQSNWHPALYPKGEE